MVREYCNEEAGGTKTREKHHKIRKLDHFTHSRPFAVVTAAPGTPITLNGDQSEETVETTFTVHVRHQETRARRM
jgi:lysophospholipid acyltransferase (LPLAT)-like uncharacterized protein